MEYRQLGNTGLKVSVIGMGCEGYVDDPAGRVERLTQAALDHGINFFELYTPQPEVHQLLGKVLAPVRDQVVIEGHLCSVWKNGQYKKTRRIDEVKAGFELQMANLATDYLDIGMIHFVDEQSDFDEVFGGPVIEYAKELKAAGRIRSIGLSSHNPLVALQAVKTGLVDVLLFSINPAYDMLPPTENVGDLFDLANYEKPTYQVDPAREELYRYCAANGIGISVMKAFAGGRLLDASRSQFARAMTPVQCIHYALTRPAVATVAAGFHTVEQFDETCAWCDATEDERDYGAVLSTLSDNSFQGACMYCGHCAPCTARIEIADVNKYADLAEAQGQVTETLREHYAELEFHASDCIGCGACETRCPFGVKIVDKMQQTAEVFGY